MDITKMDYIDLTLDIYCVKGYQTEKITTDEFDKIHKNNEKIQSNQIVINSYHRSKSVSFTDEIDKKNLFINILKFNDDTIIKNIKNIKSITNSKNGKNIYEINNMQISLTIEYFIKLISNSKIDEINSILEQDINNIYINMCDKDNDSLLHFAVFAGNYEITELLLIHGADPNKCDNEGQTPIFRTVFGSNDLIIDLLVKYQVNINTRDNDGNTPLHIAVLTKNYCIIKKLLKYDVERYALNNDNLMPLDYAVIKKNNVITFDQRIIDLFKHS